MQRLLLLLLLSLSSFGYRVVTGEPAYPRQAYRSTHTAWVIPGGAMDAPQVNMTAAEVKVWEGTHADVAFGGSSSFSPSAPLGRLGYMYNQMLDLHPFGEREYWLKRRAGSDAAYERYFLHYVEDTPYNLSAGKAEQGSLTFIDGVVTLMGYTQSPTHSGFSLWMQPPFKRSVFENHASGGMLYVMNFERFAAIEVDIAADAAMVPSDYTYRLEYISACNATGIDEATNETFPMVSRWSTLKVTKDTSLNWTRSGRIAFNLPPDQLRCSTANGKPLTYGGGVYFGSTYLREGYGLWTIRVSLVELRNASAPLPILNNLTVPWFIRYTNPADPDRRYRTIPGWNPANDRDGDGWVNNSEFADRPFPNASARMKYESRVIPLGRMWSTKSSWCRTNVFDNATADGMAAFLKQHWAKTGEKGAYNDDLLKLVGPAEFYLETRGDSVPPRAGHMHEYPDAAIDGDAIVQPYRDAFAALLRHVKEVTGSEWIMGNISQLNILIGNATIMFFWAIDCALREDYITPWLGLTGWSGIARMWDTFVYAAYGKKSLVQVLLRDASAHKVNRTKENWLNDLYGGTLMYYLINAPNSTAYQAWGNGFNYGSGNTEAPYNWFESGIPMNMAYQPGPLLDCDIGLPLTLDDGWVPEDPLIYHVKLPGNDYATIINSTSTSVQHPDLAGGQELRLVPSLIFYAWRNGTHRLVKQPLDTVLARKYTRGLVLFRTTLFGHDKNAFVTSPPVVLPLNGTFRQVFLNGSRGPPVDEIAIGVFGGAVLEDFTPTLSESHSTTRSSSASLGGSVSDSVSWSRSLAFKTTTPVNQQSATATTRLTSSASSTVSRSLHASLSATPSGGPTREHNVHSGTIDSTTASLSEHAVSETLVAATRTIGHTLTNARPTEPPSDAPPVVPSPTAALMTTTTTPTLTISILPRTSAPPQRNGTTGNAAESNNAGNERQKLTIGVSVACALLLLIVLAIAAKRRRANRIMANAVKFDDSESSPNLLQEEELIRMALP